MQRDLDWTFSHSNGFHDTPAWREPTPRLCATVRLDSHLAPEVYPDTTSTTHECTQTRLQHLCGRRAQCAACVTHMDLLPSQHHILGPDCMSLRVFTLLRVLYSAVPRIVSRFCELVLLEPHCKPKQVFLAHFPSVLAPLVCKLHGDLCTLPPVQFEDPCSTGLV